MKRSSPTLHAMVAVVSLLSGGCAALGYWFAGSWEGVVAAIVSALAWGLLHKRAPSFCLFLSVAVSVVGILLRISPGLMIASAVVSLGSWDLALLRREASEDPNGDQRVYRLIRFRALALALSSGALLVILALRLRLPIPLAVMLPAAAFVYFSVDRVYHYLDRRR